MLRALLVMALLAAPCCAGLDFVMPNGWINLDPKLNTGRLRLSGALGERVKGLRNSELALSAMDFNPRENSIRALLMATKVASTEPVTRASLERYEPRFQQMMVDAMSGSGCQLTELEMNAIGGVPVGRAVYTLWASGVECRALMYVIPGGEEVGMIAIVCEPNVWAAQQAFFDALAQATRGVKAAVVPVAPQPRSKWPPEPAELAGYVAAGLALCFGVHMFRTSAQSGKAEPAPSDE